MFVLFLDMKVTQTHNIRLQIISFSGSLKNVIVHAFLPQNKDINVTRRRPVISQLNSGNLEARKLEREVQIMLRKHEDLSEKHCAKQFETQDKDQKKNSFEREESEYIKSIIKSYKRLFRKLENIDTKLQVRNLF